MQKRVRGVLQADAKKGMGGIGRYQKGQGYMRMLKRVKADAKKGMGVQANAKKGYGGVQADAKKGMRLGGGNKSIKYLNSVALGLFYKFQVDKQRIKKRNKNDFLVKNVQIYRIALPH